MMTHKKEKKRQNSFSIRETFSFSALRKFAIIIFFFFSFFSSSSDISVVAFNGPTEMAAKKKKEREEKRKYEKNSDARVNSASLLYSYRRPNHIHNFLSSGTLSTQEKKKKSNNINHKILYC